MNFILTIDTEGDNQWDHGRELAVENIKFVPRFQELCEKYSIKPTYFVTSEVCDDQYAREIFTDYILKDTAEIGAHLHAWTTPPFYDKDGYRFNDPAHSFANELPDDLLNQKLKYLTDQIETSFGKRPLSYRSGRYGFNENVGRSLVRNGYIVDSSVSPYATWADHPGIPGGEGGPDFIDSDPFPYDYHFDEGSLHEIPITILPTRFPLNRYQSLARYYFRRVDKSIFLRVFRKLFFNNQPLWLRPNPWMTLDLFSELVNESIKIKLPNLVMMFHSSELMPGCSIYRQDNESIEKLYELLERFFLLLKDKNIDSVTMTEAAKINKI
ncbi:MAG: hypothetical protein IPN67_05780 [Bacteroidales bacterium]|nr:hypothetical protein [Bacteroidales bacterium]MBK8881898.1 hypothetical protein [Bacteroidales bacterium]